MVTKSCLLLSAVSVSESQLFFRVPPSFLIYILYILYISNNQQVTEIREGNSGMRGIPFFELRLRL